MQAPSTTLVCSRVASLNTPPAAASAWCSKRSGGSVAPRALIIRASSSSPRSAPIEQQPSPRCSAGSARIPLHPRPNTQVHAEVRKDRSKRHTVSPSTISSNSALTKLSLADTAGTHEEPPSSPYFEPDRRRRRLPGGNL